MYISGYMSGFNIVSFITADFNLVTLEKICSPIINISEMRNKLYIHMLPSPDWIIVF
jgi:hypothetical protein